MPVIAPGSKVLVTGANGFAAIHIVDALLKKGYSVRATIRSGSKGTHLRKVFGKYGDKLELVVVPDITEVRPIWPPISRSAVDGLGFRMALSTLPLADLMPFSIPPLPSRRKSRIRKVRRNRHDPFREFIPRLTATNRPHPSRRQRNPQCFEICYQGSVSPPAPLRDAPFTDTYATFFETPKWQHQAHHYFLFYRFRRHRQDRSRVH